MASDDKPPKSDPSDPEWARRSQKLQKGGDGTDVRRAGEIDPTMVRPNAPSSSSPASPVPPTPATQRIQPATQMLAKGAVPPPVIYGTRFEVVRQIGEGGMGSVFHVRDRQIEGRQVALKLLRDRYSKNEAFRKLFFQEIHAAQNFVSEHVVQVRDTGQLEDGLLFLTMDLVDGESLRELLEREEHLRAPHALEIARQMLLALQSGHEKGFVHRDVKPSNVMLARGEVKTDDNPWGVDVKLLDFGIASLAAQVETGKRMGTLRYMSPEQVQGERLDGRSDLFAVGIVLFEMLTGKRPFEGTTPDEVTKAVIEHNLTPIIDRLAELPAPTRRILTKALQKDRERRFQSASEFITAIEKSSAYRLPSAIPIWAVVTISILGLSTAGAIWFAQDRMSRTTSLQNKVDAADQALTNEKMQSRKEVAAKDDELNLEKQKEASLTQTNSDLSKQLIDAQNEVNLHTSEVAALNAKIVDLNRALQEKKNAELKTTADVGDTETRLADLERDFKKTDEERKSAQQKIRELESQLNDLKTTNEKLQFRVDPERLKAAEFDRLTSLVDRGLGGEAEQDFSSVLKRGVFESGSAGEGHFLGELIQAGSAFANYQQSVKDANGRAREQLVGARQHAAAARQLLPAFEELSRTWIGLASERGSEAPDRLAIARATLDHLDQKIEPAFNEIAKGDATEWAKITALGAFQSADAGLAHEKLFRCSHLAELAKTCADGIRARCIENDRLNFAELAKLDCIDSWADYFIKTPDAAKSESARGLVLLGFARRWYDRNPNNDTGFDWGKVDLPDASQKSSDWRLVLKLEYDLAQADSAFPIAPKRRVVYQNVGSEAIRWRIDSDATDSNATQKERRWVVTNETFTDDRALRSLPPGTSKFELRPDGYWVDGWNDPIVKFRAEAGDDVWTEPFEPAPSDNLPPALDVNTSSLREFRSEVDALPKTCLVYRRDHITRWFSPQWGLVRQRDDEGKLDLRVVYATPLH